VAVMGGYVMDSTPGLYENVMVFDFKSLYPSIIRTFNIDPLTQTRDPAVGDGVRAPNGACFRRDVPGILPALLTQLAASGRRRAQRLRRESQRIKILMNSFYGVLGASASRLFSPEVANAVTSFGQFLIRYAAEHAQQRGYRVLYGDTDSLFVQARERDPAAALRAAETLRADIGRAVGDRIRDEFGCDSVLELEFEKLYRRFFLPEVRGGKVGSKKRYAGLVVTNGEETIEFVGLEAVRRDWSEVSKRFQRELLQRVFHDEPVDGFIRAFVASLRRGRVPTTSSCTRRRCARTWLRTPRPRPPHVRAARKQTGSGGASSRTS